ncbi:unnamed protein product [Polarella glacialis]|uniref:Uncharacterized protein n=1 Tax=Polarella glacialis TaxID=89957 RepID=A0A813HX03_POLGL|nr:unnamed protein product [Polarella glacialis]
MFSSLLHRKSTSNEPVSAPQPQPLPQPEPEHPPQSLPPSQPLAPMPQPMSQPLPTSKKRMSQPLHAQPLQGPPASPLKESLQTATDTDDTQLTDTVDTTDSFDSLVNHHVTFHESSGAEAYEDEELELSLTSKENKDRYLGSLSDDQRFERLMELVEELHIFYKRPGSHLDSS